ncbi:MAG: SDR family NAD(P)-dependent oxidoreductase [Beijerinckiaceae bacterium]
MTGGKPLAGKICVVAGASRGIGRGIAQGRGEAGATVIVTGRSSETAARTDQRPETIEETARLVDAAGGKGHHYRCDHRNEVEVDRFAHWCLRRFGTVDCVVGAVWSGGEGFDGETHRDGSRWGDPFWRRPSRLMQDMLETGFHAQFLTARAFAPAFVAARRGLFLCVSFDDDGRYLGDPFYDLAKATVNRFALIAHAQLQPFGATALALAPGLVRTERMQESALAEAASESPVFAGRAAAALAADPSVARWGGQIVHAAVMARHYGFADSDGSVPDRYRNEN